MPPLTPPSPLSLATTLEETKLGTYRLPITALQHTSSGRPLHQEGVESIRGSIHEKGWLGSKMTACLVGDVPAGGLTVDNAPSLQYRLINGNHRLAALVLLLEEKKRETPSCDATIIEVDVHQPLSVDKERLVASSE